jgi:hypothetical protein
VFSLCKIYKFRLQGWSNPHQDSHSRIIHLFRHRHHNSSRCIVDAENSHLSDRRSLDSPLAKRSQRVCHPLGCLPQGWLGHQRRRRPNPLLRSQTDDIQAPSRSQVSTLPKVHDEGERSPFNPARRTPAKATPALKRLTIGFMRILLPGDWQSEQSRHLERPCIAPFVAYRYDFPGSSITTIVRRFRDRIPPHLAPPPSAGYGWSPAGAIE